MPQHKSRRRRSFPGRRDDNMVPWAQVERMRLMEEYTQRLKSADDLIMKRFNEMTAEFNRAYWLNVISSIVVIGVSVVIFGLSLYLILSGDERIPVAASLTGIFVSFVILILIYYRNPVKVIRNAVSDLVKMNVIFMGYVRQINQIDLTFKHLFESKGGDLEQMRGTVTQLRVTVDETVDNIIK